MSSSFEAPNQVNNPFGSAAPIDFIYNGPNGNTFNVSGADIENWICVTYQWDGTRSGVYQLPIASSGYGELVALQLWAAPDNRGPTVLGNLEYKVVLNPLLTWGAGSSTTGTILVQGVSDAVNANTGSFPLIKFNDSSLRVSSTDYISVFVRNIIPTAATGDEVGAMATWKLRLE